MKTAKNRLPRTRFIALALLVCACLLLTVPAVYADTDGTELLITDQPDTLTLNLGSDFAGAQFELAFDAGIFPAIITANDSGILTTEMGGSKTYTLTLLALKEPDDGAEESEEPSTEEPQPEETESEESPVPAEVNKGIPPLHLVLFFGGLAVAVCSLIIMYLKKRRRNRDYDDEYDDDDDDDE